MTAIDLSPPDTATVDRTVHRFVDAVRAEFGARLRGVYLFGSRARGDNDPDSDVDVAVVLTDLSDYADVEEFLSKASFDLFLETGVFIDPQPISDAAWTDPLNHGNPVLIEEIHRDSRRIDHG
jgi:antitoxin ChpS